MLRTANDEGGVISEPLLGSSSVPSSTRRYCGHRLTTKQFYVTIATGVVVAIAAILMIVFLAAVPDALKTTVEKSAFEFGDIQFSTANGNEISFSIGVS